VNGTLPERVVCDAGDVFLPKTGCVVTLGVTVIVLAVTCLCIPGEVLGVIIVTIEHQNLVDGVCQHSWTSKLHARLVDADGDRHVSSSSAVEHRNNVCTDSVCIAVRVVESAWIRSRRLAAILRFPIAVGGPLVTANSAIRL
jgi:hypothetical protein